ncbi:L,D-transpeptidase Cds6 family protein [Variovorax sp.]|uniref:L,D-transpeptidase Cds6 family protein n=1 Tax=Variovorax sp. TaxID=1871043 RepID=UPI003BA8F422
MNRSLTTCLLAGGLLLTTAAFGASPAAPATPSATEAAVPAPTVGIAEVEAAVRAWAAAWSARDADRYLAAYAPDFTPPRNQDRKRWETDRRARIADKSSISVGIEDLVISVNGQSASARFKQVYRADKLKETGRKTLELQRVGNQWLIRKESAGG